MSDVQIHIERIREQCRRIQEHGHCEGNGPAFVAITDVEIKLQDFENAIEDAEENK